MKEDNKFMIKDCDAFIGSKYITVYYEKDNTYLQLHEGNHRWISIHQDTLEKILNKLKEERKKD